MWILHLGNLVLIARYDYKMLITLHYTDVQPDSLGTKIFA